MSPRPARPWFRFYVEAMRDPKLRRLTPAQRWLWVAILGAARESCRPGHLLIAADVSMSLSDLADYAGVKQRDVAPALGVMHELGMVDYDTEVEAWWVPAFAERQYESDNVTERTRKHRSREQVRNVPTTPVGTDQITETDTETETHTLALVPTAAPRKRGTRVPEPFYVSPEMQLWVGENFPGLDWQEATRGWQDHWRAKSGNAGVMLDWEATWRNGMRNAKKWGTA